MLKPHSNKKLIALLLSVLLVMVFILTSCTDKDTDSNTSETDNSATTSNESSDEPLTPDVNASKIWSNDYAYGNILSTDNIYKSNYYYNGVITNNYDQNPSDGDGKYFFQGENETRIVNLTDGYMFTFPAKNITTDLHLSELRTKYYSDDWCITISYEDKSPYGNTQSGWDIYFDEWLTRYITNLDFLSNNEINITRAMTTSTDIIPNFTVNLYGYFVRNSSKLEYPYYNIAVIRENNVFDKFYLVVLKSKRVETTGYSRYLNEMFDELITSFSVIDKIGTAKNTQQQYELVIPETWNAETKAYFNKLMTQDTTDWGFFSRSMPSTPSSIPAARKILTDTITKFQSESYLDYKYDIMPTYTHIAWYNELHHFPTELANEFSGGNGFNDKPVLQFTYQFTTNNNGNMFGYSPMFDILRGKYDDHFKKLAQDIKAYKHPVLFRLNNEMNTDWTSYAGIVTMLDPDVFIETWEYLYKIFEEEGVDNCIWIFNPIAKSCPFSNWGDTLNYMPSVGTVHALGLTHYEMGNGTGVTSFEFEYKELYKQNEDNFINFPWIISEFACGAGGNIMYDYNKKEYIHTVLGRNTSLQAKWIKEMFDCFEKRDQEGYEFVKNIKGAVWFSVNDNVTINDVEYITNYLTLDKEAPEVFKVFREGLKRAR
ncbi:glycoside hydrolase family 26 protein [Eubacteriales bacterium OttesenSCG-928-G02]|nr:glycoside hydrolase family 26 protein [Eubacteriales bacterium OttesenSCG-928-G02]